MFVCTRCGRAYNKQKNSFAASQSPLYRANGAYLPICNICLDDLYNKYLTELGDDAEAVQRICMKLDIYWSMDVFNASKRASNGVSRMRSYITKTNLIHYAGKNYDDTISEMGRLPTVPVEAAAIEDDASGEHEEGELDMKLVEFWGKGYSLPFYEELSQRYKKWTRGLPKPIDSAEEAIYKQICILEAIINRDSASGRPVDKNINMLNNLIGSLNRKPVQKQTQADADFDGLPLGVGIRLYENTRPIPEPDPDFADKDGVIKTLSIWFLGHLCKMLGIRNAYCKMYEEELERYKIERPDLVDENDDEETFNNIFSNEGGAVL